MARTHVVEQGEHLTSIARAYGFVDYRTIWNHPENGKLKRVRGNAHVLLPGDQVYIPDKVLREEVRPTGAQHTFRLTAKSLRLRLVIKDFDDKPIADAECELEMGGVKIPLRTNSEGLIETVVPPEARRGKLIFPVLDLEYPVLIGHLDPSHEDSGWQARLFNLGYYIGPDGEPDPEDLRKALEEFQCDHKIRVTGKPNDATIAKLQELHNS